MKYYISSLNGGYLVSVESDSQMLKIFPDGLKEISADTAKEFSLYSGSHNYSYNEKTKTVRWSEKN